MTRLRALILANLAALLVLAAVFVGQSDWWWRERSPARMADYIASHDVRKLQLGAGWHLPEGWLNSDIQRPPGGKVYLDAMAPFPIPDDQFHYIASEHLIEHLPYEGGRAMLEESYRVLAPGGRIRITTPDLAVFVDLFDEPLTADQERFIREKLAWHDWPPGPRPETMILNLQMHEWGHTFLYDRETLGTLLREVGFEDIRIYAPGESDDPVLRAIEVRPTRDTAHLNRIEAFAIEASKP